MIGEAISPILIGEVLVDVTVTPRGQENKLRLGGITHAARGFWAAGIPFAVAAILPSYLESSAREYLSHFGCKEFKVIGYVNGAPNVVLIFDPTEVDDQEYENVLRDEKLIKQTNVDPNMFGNYSDALVFPGSYDLEAVCSAIPLDVRLHIDAAYDVKSVEELSGIGHPITTLLISTSSYLFVNTSASGISALVRALEGLNLEALILKENRGGARIHICSNERTESVPAQLGTTVNSVGVGDVYDAGYVAFRTTGPVEAAWRAMSMSSAYSQTTEPDVFRNYVQRDLRLKLAELRDLGGTFLPWEARQAIQIYLAAPDFEGSDTVAIERAVSALNYHNFRVRRPVKENGELPPNSDAGALAAMYQKDVDLLKDCQLVFAVPLGRDPGALVEIGLAIAAQIPVVVFDPARECANTMVIAGSACYSTDLDTCLNATFASLSQGRSNG